MSSATPYPTSKMTLIDTLNKLEAQSLFGPLYQARALTLATLNYREVYLHYYALLASPRYLDQPTRAVERQWPYGCGSVPRIG